MSTLFKNKWNNDELRIDDALGGHVSVVKLNKEVNSGSDIIAIVASTVAYGPSATESIRTLKDLDDNIDGINRIRRISQQDKQLLIDFLLDIRNEMKEDK